MRACVKGLCLLVVFLAAGCGGDGEASSSGTQDASADAIGDAGAETGDAGTDGSPDGAIGDGQADVQEDTGATCEAPDVTGPPGAYYVSPGASAGGDGSVAHPLSSLEEARDAIRALESKPAQGVDVYLRGGVYHRTASFQLTGDDSGAEGAPIRYRAYPCETPRIVGGTQVKGWKKLTSGPIYNRLPSEAKGHVLQIDLSAQGITDYGEFLELGATGDWPSSKKGPVPMELFINHVPQMLARYPNMDAQGGNVWAKTADGSGGMNLVYEGTRPADRHWKGDDAHGNPIMIRGYLHSWFDDALCKVTKLDTANKTITVAHTAGGSVRADHYYLAYNLLEELDAPGEYWLDRSDGQLYFWPSSPLKDTDELMVSELAEPLVDMKDAGNVTFQGLTFEVTRYHGVLIQASHDITFDHCTIRNVGGNALFAHRLSGPAQTAYVFRRGEIANAGRAAIVMGGGDLPKLGDSKNLVTDSHIHHFGRVVSRGSVGVRFDYPNSVTAGGVLQYSTVEDGPAICVHLGGALQTVEHSVIRNCVKDGGDLGAIYYGYLDPATRGITIQYNAIGDTYVRPKTWLGHGSTPYANIGVYVDGGGSGGLIRRNVVYNCDLGFLINGGKWTRFENNVFYNSKATGRIACQWREPKGKYNLGVQVFIDNKIYKKLWDWRVRDWKDHADPWTPSVSWAQQLSPYDTLEEWQALIGHVGYRTEGDYVGNIEIQTGSGQHYYEDNRYDGCPWSNDKDNLKGQDPKFVDPAAGDYRFKADSPATTMSPAFPVDEWNAEISKLGPRPEPSK